MVTETTNLYLDPRPGLQENLPPAVFVLGSKYDSTTSLTFFHLFVI
jgi:hypothetical protein